MDFVREIVPVDAPAYREVCALRELAYRTAGKQLRAPGDDVDVHCRIVLLRDGVRPVGSIRVCLSPEPDRFDYTHHPGWRAVLPPLEDCVSASRLCVDPSYRGRGLFDVLHDEMVRGALEANRALVIGSSDARLLGRYEHLGWRRIGQPYAAPSYDGAITLQYIVLDVATFARTARRAS